MLFFNSQARRKPFSKPYNPGEPRKPPAVSWDPIPSPSRQGAPVSRGGVCSSQGVISALRKGFFLLPKSFYHLPRTSQSSPNASSCGIPYCGGARCHRCISPRPVPADGCGGGKAIDLNILEGSRPPPSAGDDRLSHWPRQKKKINK